MKRERDNGFSEWGGYMSAKISKLEDQFCEEAKHFSLKEDNLFEGISIFVNGYTVPPAYELRNLMMKHGGMFHHYHKPGKTTYIVASNLPDSKLKQVNKLTVIKPEWIIDCIKANHLLNHKDYLLYTNQSKTQPLLQFDKTKKVVVRSPTKTAKDDRFLSEFYKNSRLHLISTMGATFKQYVNELRSTVKEFPGRDALINTARGVNETDDVDRVTGWGNIVMHIDMDCFFVSVSIRKRPDLVGQPVAVTHSKGNAPSARSGVDLQAEYKAYHGSSSSDPNHWSNTGQSYSMSEIASCSYEARKMGVKNGTFMGQALILCPNLITLPYDFDGYKEVAKVLYDTIARYTLNIEAVSCDEMFVDCTQLLAKTALTPLEFASIIRSEIKEKTQCPCSTGFGSNKLQARLATRKAKPDGQFFLESDMVCDFMSSIPVSDLPGVGRSTSYKLKSMGVTTCLELQKTPISTLKSEFGAKTAETLHSYAFGKDSKSLTFEKVRKSVSAEVNYGIRFQTDSERDTFLNKLSEEVSNRLIEVSMKGKSITLKIMVRSKDAPEETAKFLGHGVCDYFTKTNSLKSHTDDPSIIFREVTSIIGQFKVPSKELRGIGIQISKLISNQSSKSNINKFFFTKSDKSELSNKDSNNVSGLPQERQSTVIGNDNLDKSNVLDNEENLSEKVDERTDVFMKEIEKTIHVNEPGTSKTASECNVIQALIPKEPRKINSSNILKNSIQPDLHNISLSQIDPSFLEALPEELRAEILKSLKKQPENQEKADSYPTVLKSAPDVFTGLDNSNLHVDNENLSNDLSEKISPIEMRSLLREWIHSCESPESCDVSMFSHYLTSLVTSRQIDHLHILLKIFSRELKRRESSNWLTSYNSILEQVQAKMLHIYGATLVPVK